MSIDLILENLLSAPILFFFVGGLATLVRSDLNLPRPVVRGLSLYLLFAIGIKGGHSLVAGGLDLTSLSVLLAAVGFAALTPLLAYLVLRRLTDSQNAAALSASFGSVSAVTFITASNFLEAQGYEYRGVMVAAMALMESPAIVVGILLARSAMTEVNGNEGGARSLGERFSWKKIFREAFTNGAVFLLVASLCIGAATGERGWEMLRPFAADLFPGMLSLFLLDMGQTAAARIRALFQAGALLIASGVVLPLFFGLLGVCMSFLIGLPVGDALLFTILAGSASYIAVPAAVRLAIPKANPSIYVAMALGVTFPFNIIFGIPLYMSVISSLLENL
ncbi:sodium-dependent bicarbonate transport family permease [bacterium]|nr:sodium-dependent bicarbonate transport family permease [bacterium]